LKIKEVVETPIYFNHLQATEAGDESEFVAKKKAQSRKKPKR